jgi:hypothetical protein
MIHLVDGIPVDYSGLPERYRELVRLYIEAGVPPGTGWTYILQNDLRAVVVVDERTAVELPTIYRWLVNHAPSRAWGSAKRVNAWFDGGFETP